MRRGFRRAVVVGLLLTAVQVLCPGPADAATQGQCQPVAGRTLVVRTKPVVAGFHFELGNLHYVTDATGRATVASVTCGDVQHALGPLSGPIQQGDGTTATFDGWYGDEILGRTYGNGTIFAAFRQRTRVDLRLLDLQGAAVPRSEVGRIQIKGSTGALVDVPRSRSSVVLDASRVVRFSTGLVSKDILWSVQSADIDGNSAVNRGQVRFEPRHTKIVKIPLMLYRLQVSVHDAILHRPVGREVTVTAPDGSVRTVHLDANGNGRLLAVPRGAYQLAAGGGMVAKGFVQPVAVSRPQVADLTVVSWTDVAIALGTFLLVVLGLLAVGRWVGGSPAAEGGRRPPTSARARPWRRLRAAGREEAAP